MKKWIAVSEAQMKKGKYLGIIEFKDCYGEWHDFHCIQTPLYIVFGGMTNVGFFESGHIDRDEYESVDQTLQEMLADLEVYYNDGKRYVSRITCSVRM